ncbi:flippase-like domain-containing protein [bacterium]|nr:flippase-like domain-containing protein [bacterium]
MKLSLNMRRLLIFLGLSFITIVLIFLFTANSETYKAVKSIDIRYLLLVIGLYFTELFIDGLRLLFFVKGTGETIKFFEAVKLSALIVFFNLITPFSFGGQPFMVYVLRKEGISSGKGTSVVITRVLTMALFVFSGAIFSLLFFGRLITSIQSLRIIFLITGGLFIAFGFIAVAGLLRPNIVIKFAGMAAHILKRLHIIKDKKNFIEKSSREILVARASFRQFFGTGFGYFTAGTFLSGMMYLTQVAMLWAIFSGLGISLPYVKGFALSALLLFLIVFMPTPGTSGLGEVIFVIIFAGAVPKYLLGVAVLLWRFFYQFLTAILGGFVTAKYFSDILVKKPEELQEAD